MKRRVLPALTLPSLLLLGACSGARFRVEAPLREAPPMDVSGDRPTGTSCEGEERTALQRMTPGLQARLGTTTLRLAGAHGPSPDPSAARANLEADLEEHLRATGEIQLAALFVKKKADEVGSEDVAGGAATVADGASKVATALAASAALVAASRRLAALFRPSSETRSLTFVSRHGDAHVVSVCETTDRVRPLGALTFDKVRFTLTCHITGDHDEATRQLRVQAGGTWANTTFDGQLVTVGGPSEESARFTSQSTVILGTGAIMGFELRGREGQIAAMDLYGHAMDAKANQFEGRAWRLARGSPGWQASIDHALALAYLFPWPTACDARQRQQQAAQ